jgi:hypothetical protein
VIPFEKICTGKQGIFIQGSDPAGVLRFPVMAGDKRQHHILYKSPFCQTNHGGSGYIADYVSGAGRKFLSTRTFHT